MLTFLLDEHIDNAMDQMDALKKENFIDESGKEIAIKHYDIAFKNVNFGYDNRPILKDVSFSIPEKTSTAIVGPSGSGKTTICNLIARFYDVNSGSVTVGGHAPQRSERSCPRQRLHAVWAGMSGGPTSAT